VNIEFRTLRAAFNLAVKWQLLTENPFTKSSQVKTPEQLPSHLSKEDFRRLLTSVKEPVLREVFLFAALTGLRLGEILNLKWNDIDLQRRQIAIVSNESFSTKTGKYRIVPMNGLIYELLSQKSATANFTTYVFHRNGYQLQSSYVSHKFKRYVRSLGLNDAIHFHSLRHTFATWLVQDGVSIYEVQKLLGHSSVKVTEVYSHLAASELHNAVNKISLLLN
jgi:integrase